MARDTLLTEGKKVREKKKNSRAVDQFGGAEGDRKSVAR